MRNMRPLLPLALAHGSIDPWMTYVRYRHHSSCQPSVAHSWNIVIGTAGPTVEQLVVPGMARGASISHSEIKRPLTIEPFTILSGGHIGFRTGLPMV